MMPSDPKAWQLLGSTNPYYGVFSVERFLNSNLDDHAIDEFFESGRQHIRHVWMDVAEIFRREPRPRLTVDFGCGTGRLLLPIAERSEASIGVDISRSMLDETRRVADRSGQTNIQLMTTDEFMLSDRRYDFVHSFIVFQHIRPDIGLAILKQLIDRLEPEGIGVIHFTYADPRTAVQRIKGAIYGALGPLRTPLNKVRGRADLPHIPVYHYEIGTVMSVLQRSGCNRVALRFTDHGFPGLILFFEKAGPIRY